MNDLKRLIYIAFSCHHLGIPLPVNVYVRFIDYGIDPNKLMDAIYEVDDIMAFFEVLLNLADERMRFE